MSIAPDANKPRSEPNEESGRPGDGKGRRDEVGRTGIWPASGPLPPGEAEIISQGQLGQSARGAGSDEAGASELSTYRVDPVCGARVRVEDAPAAREYRTGTYYFDGEQCRQRFDEAPERYAHTPDIRRPDVM